MSDNTESSLFNWKTIQRAALLFFPVILLAHATLYGIYHLDKERAIESLIHTEKIVVHQQAQHFTRVFSNIISDLLVLTGHSDFTEMLNDPDADLNRHRYNISQEFLAFIDHKGVYDQLRYINMDGQEIIRVNLNNGAPTITPQNKLQNKKDRYYFKETVSLEKNELFISPFDLNIEDGIIEHPRKPMLRISIPIIDESNVSHGIVILNYLGQFLIDDLKTIGINFSGHMLLLNMDGYWLKGMDPATEWGFMFPNGRDKTFQTHYPEAWQTIATTDNGELLNEQGLFTYATVNPLANDWKSTSGKYRIKQPRPSSSNISNYSWKIVSFVPEESVLADSERLRMPMLALGVILMIIWGMYALISSSAKEQKRSALKTLKEKDQRIHEIVDSAFDGIITINEKGIISSFNPAASAIFGYAPKEIIGKNISILTPSPHRDMHDDYLTHYIQTGEAHIIDQPREVEAVRKDGSLFPMSLCVGARDYGDRWMFTGIVRDITERKLMEKELKQMAITDALTGLYNRGYLNQSLDNEYRRSIRYGTPLCLIILDIDHFKSVNDNYGHPAGDKVLIDMASELQHHSRDIDIVARYGGEEFVLILPQTDSKSGLILAERMRAAVEALQIPIHDKLNLNITISIGLVAIPETATDSADHFLTIADRALYQAKDSGRNKVILSKE